MKESVLNGQEYPCMFAKRFDTCIWSSRDYTL